MIDRRTFLEGAAAVGLLAACGPKGGSSSSGPPPPTPKTILILGGTKFLGPEVVAAARKRGHTVTLFNRGKTNPNLFPELEKLHGDRKDDLKSLEGRTWDAVVDTSGYVPRHVKMSAELLAPNVSQYVFVSTISVYDMEKFPVGGDEGSPVATLADAKVEEVTGETYGALKALCEQAAEAAMPGRVTNIRPGLIVGPNDPTDRFTYWPVRVARGGEILAPGDGGDPVQFIDARDLGEWIVRTIDEKTTGLFNATGPAGTLTMKQMLDTCRRALHSDAKFVWADAKWLEQQKVSAWMDMPVWVPSEEATLSTVNARKAIDRGLRFRPLDETIVDTNAWWNSEPEERRNAPMHAGITADREATLIAEWKKQAA
jgi:2'-hydroxyisoflavone reductase